MSFGFLLQDGPSVWFSESFVSTTVRLFPEIVRSALNRMSTSVSGVVPSYRKLVVACEITGTSAIASDSESERRRAESAAVQSTLDPFPRVGRNQGLDGTSEKISDSGDAPPLQRLCRGCNPRSLLAQSRQAVVREEIYQIQSSK